MSRCSNCNTILEAEALFCTDCGQKVDAVEEVPVTKTIGGQKTVGERDTRSGKNRTGQEDLAVGTEFADRYIIEAVIGRGGMGVVYRAKDKLTEQIVALKLIRPDRAVGEKAVKRLITEGATSRDIRHKNVIAVYDVGEVDGQPFVSMEYLDHNSLRRWFGNKTLNRETIPLRVAARIVMAVLDGLEAAHSSGIVHRDLKPENIILTDEPSETAAPLKILDFGIASVAGTLESSTGTGMGTIGYMAPEQVTNPQAATAAADLYSVSILFYELLMDVLPALHWQPPSDARSDVPLGIDRLIKDGLSNRPASRPQSAAEYRQRLITAINDNEVAPPPPPPPGGLPTAVKWIGGSVAGLLVLGVVSVATVNLGQPGDDTPGTTSKPTLSPTTPTLSPPPPRPPPPPPRPYADISGTWFWDDGTNRRVQVNTNGQFSYDWPGSNVSGQFQGAEGRFQQTIADEPFPLVGRMARVDQCHIDFEAYSPDGQILVGGGRIHVNHTPGAPCP